MDALVNYLQFQGDVDRSNYHHQQQDRMTLQVKIDQRIQLIFSRTKQAWLFASFIWNIVVTQWASLNSVQQQQYVVQNSIANVWSNYSNGEFTNHPELLNQVSQYHSITADMILHRLKSRYRQEAAAKECLSVSIWIINKEIWL